MILFAHDQLVIFEFGMSFKKHQIYSALAQWSTHQLKIQILEPILRL
jgi:hypothetical protein